MVFGIFKKPPEKMTARPAAKPKPMADAPTTAAPAAEARAPSGNAPALDWTPSTAAAVPSAAPAAAAQGFDDDLESLDFTGIQLQEETDPLQAVIEQVAISYANGGDDEAMELLTDAVRSPDNSPQADRLWMMLFDLCQVTGNRAGFTEIELEYAQRFEKQPPVWKEPRVADAVAAAGGAATLFKGDLVAANSAGFDAALQVLEKGPKLRLDLAKVKAVDPDGCARLSAIAERAKKLKRECEWLGMDVVAALLQAKVAEQDRNQPYWRLLLEIYQRQAKQEDFENLAVDFAIAFEISPPSYEAPPKVATKAEKAPVAVVKRADDAFYMEGEIAGGRVDGLDPWLKDREQAVIDMSGVARMDFVSAGQMLNVVTPHWQRGASIVIRQPNALVAELLAVVGMAEMAKILVAKR
jgi:anti-anti-sigma regulatory factor